ncbi:MAG: histidine phosphatase family protein [Candidatus Borkfalkiaceae bacterium]|nr:histidine phosphatase family protein [Clostridia bacterium]MDY6224081.1 histidine phosphatase family protein [Christensenellaceae bacterium]
MTKFVIVRHGQSEANLQERYAGCYNAALTPTGKKQADLLADYVLKTYRVDAVYSSPLSRARETVEKIAERAGVPLKICEDLREIYGGKWEGLPLPEIAENYPQDAYIWKTDIGRARPTGGESFAEVQARADKALRNIAEENPGKTVVIGTHGGVIRSLQCLFNGVPVTEMKNILWTPNASVSEVNYENGAYKPVIMGYTGHLTHDLITRLAELK